MWVPLRTVRLRSVTRLSGSDGRVSSPRVSTSVSSPAILWRAGEREKEVGDLEPRPSQEKNMDNACGQMKQIQHSSAPQRAGFIFRRTREMTSNTASGSAPPNTQHEAFIVCEMRDHEVAEGPLACAEATQYSPCGEGQRAPMQWSQTKHLPHVQDARVHRCLRRPPKQVARTRHVVSARVDPDPFRLRAPVMVRPVCVGRFVSAAAAPGV